MLRATVRASDGGTPALSDEALITITIVDSNDHAPTIEPCELSAVVQEAQPAGQSLLTLAIHDADGASNGAPFRVELAGDGASAFSVDPLHNLITTRALSFVEQREFRLNVTARDVGGLTATCPLHVLVKQQSRHAPEVRGQLITLNTLYGEFLGGRVGRVHAIDKVSDELSFAFSPFSRCVRFLGRR